jgi:hypothetical protein
MQPLVNISLNGTQINNRVNLCLGQDTIIESTHHNNSRNIFIFAAEMIFDNIILIFFDKECIK